MKRVTKRAEDRRAEILEVSRRLFARRGYEATSVQAIIDEIGISKGAFYHHFRSKTDLLTEMLAGMIGESIGNVRPALDDPELSAIDKFNGVFERNNAWKFSQSALMAGLGKALKDDVALFQRHQQAIAGAYAPLIAGVIREGVEAGDLDCPAPEHTAPVIWEILEGLSGSLWRALFDPGSSIDALMTIVEARARAIERVLGAPTGVIRLMTREALERWLSLLSQAQ